MSECCKQCGGTYKVEDRKCFKCRTKHRKKMRAATLAWSRMREEDDGPDEATLNRIIAEQMANLPEWWEDEQQH